MGAVSPRLAGRERELAVLSHEFSAVLGGEARTILLRGEPGIGKTALMDAAWRRHGGGATVLAARNLPLTTRVPNLAVRSLLKQSGDLQRADADHRPTPIALDTAVDRLLERGPVIIAMDDLHWADSSTLDALMFLAGGPEDRRLGIIGTMRAGAGRPIDRWRADLLRLPSARAVDVGPLDRPGMRELVEDAIGAPPHESLVSDVLARTRGNPYHATLLLEGVAPSATAAPSTVAADLGSALLRAWSQLPQATQELCTMLAMHGKPVRVRTLVDVDPSWSDAERDLRPALAVQVLDIDDEGRAWFHHPLTAEILVASVPQLERRERHAELARSTERAIAYGSASPELLVDLADHLAAAGDTLGCLDASRRAIEALERSGDRMTRLRLLRRSVRISEDPADRPAGRDEAAWRDGRRTLIEAWADAAASVGAYEDEYEAVGELLDGVDAEAEPMVAARLMLRRQRLQFRIGGDLADAAPAREALRLAATAPESPEYATALVELAHAEILVADPRCAAHAAESLERATALGDTAVLAASLAVCGQLAALTRDLDRARALAARALEVALPNGHFWSAMLAAFWEAYSMPDYRSAQRSLRHAMDRLGEAGAPYLVTATLALTEARTAITVGDVTAARAALRYVRSEDPTTYIAMGLANVSAILAALQGRADDAEAYLHRAREQVPEVPSYAMSTQAHTGALARLAEGDPEGALAVLEPLLATAPGDNSCEWLVPLAARALADLAQGARDRHEPDADVVERLDEFEAAYPHVLARTLGISFPADLAALESLYAAERARARDLPEAGDLWMAAVGACAAAQLAWEEAYACRRGAEHDLTSDAGRRERGVELLRRGAALARRLEADPLTADLESLAQWSRVRLYDDRSELAGSAADRLGDATLTRRERELLPYVVDGRTYAEIAALLTISEKTVSSHISNLLRKTGAANRVDLARMAEVRERSA
ncbi:helix-turn-helix transcriptional regulator [Agromyces kandeliae]|uniref:AAA family ATPase n=1 Tax=Agromyces kandeliae TaxID=2666141 RepID=A0A6L5R337_9MICO|nr:AAA family ATPase [Agromyces kandeliae]MRX43974.1 AAA family ATPase [Agromyces kandeliae]